MIANILKIPYWLIAGLLKIFTRKRLFVLNSSPYLIGIISFFIFASLSFSFKEEIIAIFLSNETSWIFSSLSWFAFILLTVISAGLSLITCLLLGSIFIEFSTEELLRLKGFKIPEHIGLKNLTLTLLRSFKDDGVRIIYISLLGILVFICGFFPPLMIIAIVLTSFIVGIDLLNLPLALLETPFKQRLTLAHSHFIETCILGGAFTIVALVPFLGIILYPAFLNASVELISIWDGDKSRKFRSLQ
ncbi:MAG: hypothetical protein R3A13_03635 [Bdellovibrionota bacterium]